MENYKSKSKDELIQEIEKLKQNEKKYKALYNKAPFSYQSLDFDGNLLEVNSTWLKTLGYKKKEVIGNRFDAFLHPDYVEHFRKRYPEFKKQGYIHDVQFKIRHKNGNFLDISFDGFIGYTAEGKFNQTYCSFKDITKQKKAEKLLTESESNLNALINNQDESVWSLDKNLNYVIFNDFFSQFYFKAFNIKLKKGMNALKILSPKLKAFWKPKYETVLKGEKIQFEYSEIIKNSRYYFEINLNPIISDTEIIGISAVSIDITTITNTKNALKESEMRFRSILEHSFEGIGLVNNKYTFTYVNNNLTKLLGYSENEIIGEDFRKFLAPENINIVKKRYKKRQKGERIVSNYEIIVLKKNGDKIMVQLSSSVFENKKGIKQTLVQLKDKTEIKKTEQQLKESEARYFNLLETAPIGIAVHGDGKVLYINSAGADIIAAKSPEEIIGKSIINFVPKENLVTVYKQIKETLKGKKHIIPVDEEFIRTDKKKIDIEISATPILFNGKNAVQIIVSDISKRKKAEKELEKYRNKLEILVKERTVQLEDKTKKIEDSQKAMRYLLEDVNEARTDLSEINKKLSDSNNDLESFAYSVSHDLKSPLRAIIGYTKVLLEDFFDNFEGDSKEFLDLILKNSQIMNTLIDDLLRFARTGRSDINRIEFNLSVLVKDVFNSLKQNYPDKKTKILIKENIFINADIGSIKQVVFNLLNNALKFSKENESSEIEFGTKTEKGQQYFFIKDKGIGFDMKYHDKLFGVFQRLHTSEKYEGTGVGLSLVKRIIQKHGGNVHAESELGKGSTFYFTVS